MTYIPFIPKMAWEEIRCFFLNYVGTVYLNYPVLSSVPAPMMKKTMQLFKNQRLVNNFNFRSFTLAQY